MAPSLITSWQIEGEKVEAVTDFLVLGSEITADGDHSYGIRRWLLLGRKATTNLDSVLKSRHYFTDKIQIVKASHVQTWELDHKEGWMPKKWCFQTVVLEKTFQSPVDTEQIKPVNLKGNQFWILIGKTNAKAEALGDLPNPGIEPRYPALQADALYSEPPGKPHIYTNRYKIPGKGNGNLLQYSCLENARDRGAW